MLQLVHDLFLDLCGLRFHLRDCGFHLGFGKNLLMLIRLSRRVGTMLGQRFDELSTGDFLISIRGRAHQVHLGLGMLEPSVQLFKLPRGLCLSALQGQVRVGAHPVDLCDRTFVGSLRCGVPELGLSLDLLAIRPRDGDHEVVPLLCGLRFSGIGASFQLMGFGEALILNGGGLSLQPAGFGMEP